MQECDYSNMQKELITLADRLIDARSRLGWKKADLRRAAGLKSASTLTELENGTIKDSPQLPKIAYVLGVEVLWLQFGTGPRERRKSQGDENQTDLSPSSDTQSESKGAESNVSAGPDIKGRIPLISWVQAGMWSDAVDIYEPGYAERWLPFMKNNGENVFALRVDGDSMTSRFGKSYPEGCIIFVDPDQRMPNNGDRIVAKLEGSDRTTFKVFTEDAGRRWLRPLNDSHPPFYDHFTVVGKVIGKWEDE